MAESAEYNPLSVSNTSSRNYKEYFLQGSVVDTAMDKLIHRLQGLCENVPKSQFIEREQLYILKTAAGTGTVTVKVNKDLRPDKANMPWQMKYIGVTESGKIAPSRSVVTVSVAEDPSKFLDDLNFKKEFECILSGFFFRKGGIKITMQKMSLIKGPNTQEKVTNSQLVEISLLAQAGQDSAAEEVHQFAELLKPIITFEIDHRRVSQML